jgi:hypothetical protein
MTRSTKKFIAVFMLLWLPVFTGNALAAAVFMQLPQGECHVAPLSHDAMDMDMSMDMNMDMGEHQMHHGDMPSPAGEHSSCGVCHLACTAYLAVPGVAMRAEQAAAREVTPYLVVFHSFTSAPLVPPPLVRA